MSSRFFAFFLILICSLNVVAQSDDQKMDRAEDYLGVWISDNEEEHFEMYERDGAYYGKIIWVAYSDVDGKSLHDHKNPDPELRKRGIVGMEMLMGFRYKGNGVFDQGRVYDPGSGNTYKCKVKVSGNTAKIRGYIGIPLLGRTEMAHRPNSKTANK